MRTPAHTWRSNIRIMSLKPKFAFYCGKWRLLQHERWTAFIIDYFVFHFLCHCLVTVNESHIIANGHIQMLNSYFKTAYFFKSGSLKAIGTSNIYFAISLYFDFTFNNDFLIIPSVSHVSHTIESYHSTFKIANF